jgi:hypothetical protein
MPIVVWSDRIDTPADEDLVLEDHWEKCDTYSEAVKRYDEILAMGATYTVSLALVVQSTDYPREARHDKTYCVVCGAKGFEKSETGSGCEFCDGTVGGNPPGGEDEQ